MDINPAVRAAIFLLVPLLVFSACGSFSGSPSPEEIRRQSEQAELARLRAKERAERQDQAEDQRAAEQREELSALPPEFGTPAVPESALAPPPEPASAADMLPGAVGAPPIPAAGTFEPLPYDQALPPLPERVLRIAVLGAPSQRSASDRIGVMLSEGAQDGLEKSLGVAVRIIFLSQAEGKVSRATRVLYRDRYIKAAVRVARSIPQAQKIEPMSDAEADRHGVDVMVHVGLDLKP